MKKNKPTRGRPGCLAFQFAAHLLARRTGQNEKYCRALIQECVSELDSRGWALVALSLHDEGQCRNVRQFSAWLEDLTSGK
jgi:hypothetical protein